MRILFLTSRLPYPPNRGDRSRVFNFIKHLSRAHQLSLVSFIAQESEREHLAPLRSYCRGVRVVTMSQRRSALSVLFNLWRREPLQALYYRSGAMRRLVDRMLSSNQFDVIFTHLFRMAPYVAAWPLSGANRDRIRRGQRAHGRRLLPGWSGVDGLCQDARGHQG